MDQPIAYHLTWTTYGSWLPGDARGWVMRGKPEIQRPDATREEFARDSMSEDPVVVSADHRTVVRQAIEDHCRFRGWELHAVNPRTNHVHVVVSANAKPELVRDQLKAWCSRRLNELWPGRKRWWTYKGKIVYVWDDRQLAEAIDYVLNRQ